MSTPNSPGGFITVSAIRSVAQMVRVPADLGQTWGHTSPRHYKNKILIMSKGKGRRKNAFDKKIIL